MRLRTATALALPAAVWAAPALAWWDPLRNRLLPGLAGIGPEPRHVALTFDDGPDAASTPAVLEALDGLGWRATFFMLGEMVEAAPGLAAEVAGAGHEVAVHGYEHRGALRRTPAALTADLCRAVDAVRTATGRQARWYRPPFGELSAGALFAARRAGVRPVLWSAWGRDWRPEATPETIVDDLHAGILAGGTIVLHDSDCASAPGSWKTTVAALPLLAGVLAEQLLTVGPLTEHMNGGR